MKVQLEWLPMTVLAGVVASWWVFALLFLLRRKAPEAPERKRSPASRLGIILQGASYALVWAAHREYFTPLASVPKSIEWGLAVATLAVSASSVWLILSAVQTLGKQWAFAARVVEGHKLVTEGPYRQVRNPIYLGMLGMLVATGLATSIWWALLVAVAVFLLGSFIRIRTEEELLREFFGEKFESYARRVPAMFPHLF